MQIAAHFLNFVCAILLPTMRERESIFTLENKQFCRQYSLAVSFLFFHFVLHDFNSSDFVM